MARASMTDLITRTRSLIGDVSETSPTFTDDEIESSLDARRLDFPIAMLEPRDTILASGAVEYREYFAEGGEWESNVTLQGSGYETLTPDEAYPMQGRWIFDPPIQTGVVYIRGTRYDVNGAAADLAEMWLARVALEFDYSRGSRSYSRSQKRAGLEALIKVLRTRQWLTVGEQVRTDMVY